ncbi:MAG: DMT family transporter [Firmicutes bacterium]|nr:DMT family transporter [Bacillota bacterium]
MQHRYTFILALAAFIWGIGFVAQTAAMEYISPFTFNALRFGIGGLLLVVVALAFDRLFSSKKTAVSQISSNSFKKTLHGGFIVGFILFVSAALQQWGIALTGSAGVSGFITGLYIVLVPILGIFIKQKTSRFVWIGAIIATAGLYFMNLQDGIFSVDVGTILLLACAFGWAVHILAIDKYAADIKPMQLAAGQCLICAVFSLVAAIIFEDMLNVQISVVLQAWLPLGFSIFIAVLLAFTLQIIGQRHVPPAHSAVIFSLESVFAALGEAVILGVFLTMYGYIGGALIFVGIIISQGKLFTKRRFL